jgi:hypothetical protein
MPWPCPCSTGCGFALQQWIEEMAVHLKAIDPNHLVTVGEEGFYSTTCERFAGSVTRFLSSSSCFFPLGTPILHCKRIT